MLLGQEDPTPCSMRTKPIDDVGEGGNVGADVGVWVTGAGSGAEEGLQIS